VGVKPVDANQQIKLISKTFDRVIGQAQETCSFATSNLGAQGAGE
jgi:hypothetical protein